MPHPLTSAPASASAVRGSQRLLPAARARLRLYWPLLKSLQTGLLVSTGLAGYMSARCPVFNAGTVIGVALSLFLAVAGSTVLNMWWDRDIDSRMQRTQKRPLPSGEIPATEALRLGLVLAIAGVGLGVLMDARYGLVVFLGLFCDVVVYTLWLKRRTCWSIVWGGIAGGMPILAGRVLAVGGVDGIGILLALSILFWIPTHILTYAVRYAADYQVAGIPTFASTYGVRATRWVIAVSTLLAALSMGGAAWAIELTTLHLGSLAALSLILVGLAALSLIRPTPRANAGLFKYASIYMLLSMVLIVL